MRERGKKGAESREQEEGDTQTELKRDAHTNRLEGADAYVKKNTASVAQIQVFMLCLAVCNYARLPARCMALSSPRTSSHFFVILVFSPKP